MTRAAASAVSHRALVAAGLLYAALVASVGVFHVTGDGIVYYRFLERLFGGHPPHPYAYQFGTALWNAPFWAVGLVFDHPQAGFAVGADIALVIASALCLALLARLDLPASPWILVLAVFGSPLWYYTIFDPAYSHALDALLISALALALTVRARPSVVGAIVGAAILTRYVNVVWIVAALLPCVLRREWFRGARLAGSCAAVAALGFAIPVIRGIPFGNPGLNDPTEAPRHHLDAQLDVLAPAKMLFSLHRGLFLWTPLTLLGVVGFAVVLRRRHELELYAIATGSLLLLLAYAGWGKWWDGGFSFSERYLACLLPIFAIGLAELARRTSAAVVLAVVCVAWSMFIGVNHHYGFRGIDAEKSVADIARARTPFAAAQVVVAHVRGRFR